MNQKLLLPVVSYDEFSGHTRKLTANVRMSDLRNISLPLNANVRRPTRNHVVESILSSIKDKHGTMLIDAPIFVVCENAKGVISRDGLQHFLELEFLPWQGVLDGGHRLESARIANIDQGTYDTDNVFMQFQIEVGLSQAKTNDKAVALNTSKNPARFEIMNFQGKFDWMKRQTEGTKYKYIQYCTGTLPGGFEGDPVLRITNLVSLPSLVDPRFDPHKLGASALHRHPISLSLHNCVGARNRIKAGSAQCEQIGSMIIDLLDLYCLVFELIDIRQQKTRLPLIRPVKDLRKGTHLPDGTILMYKHPARLYACAILSCFRLLMNIDLTWKVNPIENLECTKRFVNKLITELKVIMTMGERDQMCASVLAKDAYIWDRMYAKAETEIDKDYKGLIGEAIQKIAS